MKLETYLKTNNTSVQTFAAATGLARQTIYAYLNGDKMPRLKTMRRITECTNGHVTANDFFEVTCSK